MFRPVLLSETLCNATRNSSVPDQLNDALYYYLCRGSYVFISVSLFVCRIMPKLVDQFSHNLMEIGMYGRICIIRHLFSSNNCAISADLAEVCALLSAILVYIKANSGFVIKTFLCYFQYCFFFVNFSQISYNFTVPLINAYGWMRMASHFSQKRHKYCLIISLILLLFMFCYFTLLFFYFLGRLPKVDLIILEGEKCPSVHPYVRPSVHKKFLRFQWNLVYR